ncbi:MAG: energy transducer TonB [Myxococcales bacterium]|nr:energy transducer TonB [Myxococcales bacterium]
MNDEARRAAPDPGARPTRRSARPRARSARPARPGRLRLPLTVALTAAINLALLWALLHVAERPAPAVDPVLVTALSTLTPPPRAPAPAPAPPPPADRRARQRGHHPAPLPPLALAPIGDTTALALPTLAVDVDPADLPALVFPTVAAAAPAARATGPADRGAMLVFAPDLEDFYPTAARSRRVEGTTRVRIAIDARGAVTAVEVLASAPIGVFDDAARVAARQLRYAPATRAGVPIATTVELNLRWSLR